MSKLIFVNAVKKERADSIYALISGAVNPRTEEDSTLLKKFSEFLKEADVDSKDKEASIEFIYEKLGGLVRTYEQDAQVKAKVAKKAPAKKKNEEEE